MSPERSRSDPGLRRGKSDEDAGVASDLETLDEGGLIAAAIASGTTAPSLRRVAADELAAVEDRQSGLNTGIVF